MHHMTRKKRQREAAAAVTEFNTQYPVGTPVLFWPGAREGDGRASRTRTPAWTIGDGMDPVVSVDDYPGGIALSHVQPLEPEAEPVNARGERQCRFEFVPGVRCANIAGHDEPYYPYLDRGQWGEYSDILTRGTEHAVYAPAAPVPPEDEWSGLERKDTTPRYRFEPTAPKQDPAAAPAVAVGIWAERTTPVQVDRVQRFFSRASRQVEAPSPDDGRWVDKQGDVWTAGADGLMHTPETAPFTREHVEKKWGPLRRLEPHNSGHEHCAHSLAAVGSVVCCLCIDLTKCAYLEPHDSETVSKR